MTKLRNIEFLRIFFAIAIVYVHIFGNMLNYVRGFNNESLINLIQKLGHNASNATTLVYAFVMLAGFFLFYSIKKSGGVTCLKFFMDKLFRLYPVVAFAILTYVIMHFCGIIKANFYTLFLNLITLQSIGVNLDYRGITWFVSPFFWSMVFIFGMFKTFDKKVFHFLLAVLVYISFVTLVQKGFSRETIGYFLNLGVLIMISCLGLGYFIGMLHDKVKNSQVFEKHKIQTFIWFSLAEIITFVCVVNWTIFHKISYPNKFIFIPIFAILIFSFVMNKGLLSKLTDNKFFDVLGKYSYSIYVMQQTSFWLLGLFLWKNSVMMQNYFALSLTLSLLFSALLGIVTYYLVEKPAVSWYKSLSYNKENNI